MNLPHFDGKQAVAGGLIGAWLTFSAARFWWGRAYGIWDRLPWLETALWVAGALGVVVGGFMGDDVRNLPARLGNWFWEQFFGPSR